MRGNMRQLFFRETSSQVKSVICQLSTNSVPSPGSLLKCDPCRGLSPFFFSFLRLIMMHQNRIMKQMDMAFPNQDQLLRAGIPFTLMEWEELDFELPSQCDLGILPPPTENVDFGTWYKYFKNMENWIKCRRDNYLESPESFFSQLPYITKATMTLVHTSKILLGINAQKFVKMDIDRRMWQYAIQDIIKIDRMTKITPNSSQSEKLFKEVFYNRYLEKVLYCIKEMLVIGQNQFGYTISEVWNRTGFHKFSTNPKPVYLDLVYKLFVYIGDCYRYSRPINEFKNLAHAFYDRARLVDFSNEKAYYQMGVLCHSLGDMLASMYYFMRAYSSPGATDRPRIDILEIHHKAFRKHLAERNHYWYSLSKYEEGPVKRNRNYKREHWILPNPHGKIANPPPAEVAPPNKQQHLASLDPIEIYRRFSVTYLLVIGKLFSGINMEEFDQVAEESLVYFEGLLKTEFLEQCGSGLEKMLQIVALSILVIDCLQKRSSTSKNTEQMQHNLNLGTLYVMELFSIVAERLALRFRIMTWDHVQTEYLSSAVMVWVIWLSRNVTTWTKPHIRPLFSIRRIEKSRNLNRFDQTDDVMDVFAELITQMDRVLNRNRNAIFPKIDILDSDEKELCKTPIPSYPEVYHLNGVSNLAQFPLYSGQQYYQGEKRQLARAQLLVRITYIHVFGKRILCQNHNLLEASGGPGGGQTFKSISKLLMPKNAQESCGLNERHYWYWMNLYSRNKREDELAKMPKNRNRPDCNGAFVMVRKTKKPEFRTGREYDVPITEINKMWCLLNKQAYRSDIVINVRRLVFDTNCFINKLECVKKLVQVYPYPLVIPITVVLELKGLSKGGMRVRDRNNFAGIQSLATPEALEKIRQGNEVAISAKEALDYINQKPDYFRLVTIRGHILPIGNIFNRIEDDRYDPAQRNDNRILEACIYLELNDGKARKRDIPMRLFRGTVLLTNDCGLRVKSIINELPTKGVESILAWIFYWNDTYKRLLSKQINKQTRRRRRT